MTGINKERCRFVEQKFLLSSNFRCDQIHSKHCHEFSHTLLCYLCQTCYQIYYGLKRFMIQGPGPASLKCMGTTTRGRTRFQFHFQCSLGWKSWRHDTQQNDTLQNDKWYNRNGNSQHNDMHHYDIWYEKNTTIFRMTLFRMTLFRMTLFRMTLFRMTLFRMTLFRMTLFITIVSIMTNSITKMRHTGERHSALRQTV